MPRADPPDGAARLYRHGRSNRAGPMRPPHLHGWPRRATSSRSSSPVSSAHRRCGSSTLPPLTARFSRAQVFPKCHWSQPPWLRWAPPLLLVRCGSPPLTPFAPLYHAEASQSHHSSKFRRRTGECVRHDGHRRIWVTGTHPPLCSSCVGRQRCNQSPLRTPGPLPPPSRHRRSAPSPYAMSSPRCPRAGVMSLCHRPPSTTVQYWCHALGRRTRANAVRERAQRAGPGVGCRSIGPRGLLCQQATVGHATLCRQAASVLCKWTACWSRPVSLELSF
jgi:hypothetical protein